MPHKAGIHKTNKSLTFKDVLFKTAPMLFDPLVIDLLSFGLPFTGMSTSLINSIIKGLRIGYYQTSLFKNINGLYKTING